MSKKVLVLSGSPRKNGNSDILCDEFIKGAKESKHDVEKILLGDKNINYCIGCYGCNRSRAYVHDNARREKARYQDVNICVQRRL